MIEAILAILAVTAVFYLIIKNYQPALVLLSAGLFLLIAAWILGKPLLSGGESTGFLFLDIFKQIELLFVEQLSVVGITIMTLFGFASYMNTLGATDVAVSILTKPLGRIKAKYVLVPVVFLIGNVLCLFIPSSSSLAVILMAILYPVLKKTGLSALTAGGVIATVATIAPTPLGADNVIASKTLGYSLFDYVFLHHALISVPTIFVMALAHYFWQKYMDKRQGERAFRDIEQSTLVEESKELPPKFYAVLPLLPLFFIVALGVFFPSIKVDVVILTLLSFFIAVLIEFVRKRKLKNVFDESFQFFKGMGQGFTQVVIIVISGVIFAKGLQTVGVVEILSHSIENLDGAGTVLILVLSGAIFLFGIVSGGGTPLFYATINLIPDLADSAHVDGIQLALPMQLIAHLTRSISPVAGVIMIVASVMKVPPIEIVKRTSVPILIGIVMVVILSFIVL
ncbi:transporter, anaerobic C4-dicarboxylate uptake C family protein [Listeria floridensis FSL S10-1187]|uniref:Transporter, anaerobic C4-dicarboxylate uptake C family protein n=1 Tax=Listeria floridensis FSL S10-1187 TaxID=1265817 RepID=A0ABN0RH07_9LIST|nr:C4-dicarboxylate transporter DcuC [Listeria floridensis]EUJ33203.1 transporter, anaerobic C4-dicarboxylate uptake C family protein [Listeria floridensis FSL S10-1187]